MTLMRQGTSLSGWISVYPHTVLDRDTSALCWLRLSITRVKAGHCLVKLCSVKASFVCLFVSFSSFICCLFVDRLYFDR